MVLNVILLFANGLHLMHNSPIGKAKYDEKNGLSQGIISQSNLLAAINLCTFRAKCLIKKNIKYSNLDFILSFLQSNNISRRNNPM